MVVVESVIKRMPHLIEVLEYAFGKEEASSILDRVCKKSDDRVDAFFELVDGRDINIYKKIHPKVSLHSQDMDYYKRWVSYKLERYERENDMNLDRGNDNDCRVFDISHLIYQETIEKSHTTVFFALKKMGEDITWDILRKSVEQLVDECDGLCAEGSMATFEMLEGWTWFKIEMDLERAMAIFDEKKLMYDFFG